MPILNLRLLRGGDSRPNRTADPLADLAAAAAEGDADALRTLIVSLGPAMLRAARGILGRTNPDLEDVAQEAALAFARALPGYRTECTVTHFAYRIAVLTAISARRRAQVRTLPHAQCVEADLESTDASSPARLLSASLRREALRALCETLPAPQAEALAMMCVMGLTVEEIAAAVGVPANTVWSRLRLAKKALRDRVREDPRIAAALEVDE